MLESNDPHPENLSDIVGRQCDLLETAWQEFRQGTRKEQPQVRDYLPQDPETCRAAAPQILRFHLKLYYEEQDNTVLGQRDFQGFAELHESAQLNIDLIVFQYEQLVGSNRVKNCESYLNLFPDYREDLQLRLRIATDEPGKFGEYDIIEELGRGGMGIVHKAKHRDLGRHVAIKRILGTERGRADADYQLLFKHEAKKVASLEHPNIVHLFAYGISKGQPWFTLEYVEGGTLKNSLEAYRLPIPDPQTRKDANGFYWSKGLLREREQKIATLIKTIAGAVGHAHSRSIVHQDLKLDNILLTKDGTPKITDFGLGKVLNSADRSEANHPIGGTISYMAPEQAALELADRNAERDQASATRVEELRREVSQAADIYAIGAVLYALLTGRPPYSLPELADACNHLPAQDRLARRIRMLEFVTTSPPKELRSLNPNVSLDLEAICAKCLQIKPADRYGSAMELEEDLRLFQTSMPIKARDTSLRERTGKWIKRHPAGAALIVVSVLATLFIATYVGWSNVALRAERDRTAQQRDLAKELLGLAQQAVNDYTTRLSQDPRIRSRDLEDLRKELLATAVGYYEALTRLFGDDPEIQIERGKGYGRLAEITAEIGAKSDATELYDKAQAAFGELTRAHPHEEEYQRALATTLSKQASLLWRIDQPDRAEAAYQQAIDIWRKVAADPQGTPFDRQSEAGVCGNMANFLRETGRPDTANDYYLQSLKLLEDLATQDPAEPEFARDLAATHRNFGLALVQTGQIEEAERRMALARDKEESLVAADPKNEEYQVHLGATLNNLAILYTDTGRPGEAAKAYARAIELGEELFAAHPRVLAYRFDLSKSLNNLGTLLVDLGQVDKAEKALLRARDLRLQLVQADPADTEFKHELAGSFNNLGLVYRQQRKYEQADIAYREANRLRAQLVESESPAVDTQVGHAAALNNRANLLDQMNQPELAAEARKESLRILRAFVTEFPQHPEYTQELSKVLVSIGDSAAGRRDWGTCLPSYDEALRLRQKLAEDHPTVAEFQRLLTTVRNNRARAYHFMKRFDDAAKEYQEAIRINSELARLHPTIATGRHSLVLNLNNLATAYGEANENGKAEETFKAALAEAVALARDFEPLPDYEMLRSTIFNGLGVVYMRTQRRSQGEQAFRDAIAIVEKLHREFPQNADIAAGLGLKYSNMGDITRDLEQPETALDWYAQATSKLEALFAAQPLNRSAQEYLALSHAKRAEFLANLGRHAEAVSDWEAALKQGPPEMKRRLTIALATSAARLGAHARAAQLAEEVARNAKLDAPLNFDRAVVYAICAERAAADDKLDEVERQKLVEGYARKSMALLVQADEAGLFRDNPAAVARVGQDSAFAALRGRSEFQQFLRKIDQGSR